MIHLKDKKGQESMFYRGDVVENNGEKKIQKKDEIVGEKDKRQKTKTENKVKDKENKCLLLFCIKVILKKR